MDIEIPSFSGRPEITRVSTEGGSVSSLSSRSLTATLRGGFFLAFWRTVLPTGLRGLTKEKRDLESRFVSRMGGLESGGVPDVLPFLAGNSRYRLQQPA